MVGNKQEGLSQVSEVAPLYHYKSLLVNRRAVSAADLMAELEISPATFKRDLAKLRDQLRVPIVFDRDQGRLPARSRSQRQ